MSASGAALPAAPVWLRLVGAIGSLALAVVAIVFYANDLMARRPSDEFMKRFRVELRRPLHAATIPLAPASDLGYEVAADVALQDAIGTVNLEDLEPAQRQAWIESVSQIDDELAAGRELMLRAIAARPGWPYHQSMLGELVYAQGRRGFDPRLATAPDPWRVPLTIAASAAPADDSLWAFLAGAYVDLWDDLPPRVQQEGPAIFRRALRDPEFVASSFGAVIDDLGRDRAFALLPDDARPLQAAWKDQVRAGDVPGAIDLFTRYERVERNDRIADLKKIREHFRLRDTDGVRQECARWASLHSIWQNDTPAGAREAGEVLEMWPADPGSWSSDPRSDFVRYFIDGKRSGISGDALARAAESLGRIPQPMLARVRLRRGDATDAERLANSSETLGSFEWTPFLVDLARHQLDRGDLDAARRAVALIPVAALDECDALLVRRDFAGDASARAAVQVVSTPANWSGEKLPLCIDPARSNGLSVVFSASRLSLVGFGWDGGRSGVLQVGPGLRRLTVPLGNRSGRHIFGMETLVGGPVVSRSAEIR